jgi:hypothetical protein
MKKFLITEEEKSRILGMHKSAIAREFLGEQATPAAPAPAPATPAPAAAAPTTTTQTTQPPAVPSQQAIKKEFIFAKNGTSVGMSSIDTDVKAVITKLSDKNGTYYSVEFINTPSVDNLVYRPGQPFKTDSVVNADPSKFGISTTDRAELNGINTMMSKQIRTAADSLK